MVEKTLTDYGRLDLNFHRSMVKEVLPEYFTDEYPNLITFLEGYYEFLDSGDNFGALIQDLYTIRDVEASSLTHLDNMFKEFAQGMSQDFFKNPREIIRNFARFFRVKGSRYSAEGFFRAFYGENVEISFPKNDIFILNDSNHQVNDEFSVIQDGAAFQILSIMLKVPLSMSIWEEQYKKFVHPAGFFLSNEVLIQPKVSDTVVSLPAIFDSTKGATLPVLVFDDNAGIVMSDTPDITIIDNMGATAYVMTGDSTNMVEFNQVDSITSSWTANSNNAFGLKDSSISYTSANPGSNRVFSVRMDPNETVEKYKDDSIGVLDKTYRSIFDMADASSPRLDRNPINGFPTDIRFDNTKETFDQGIYDSHGRTWNYMSNL